MATLLALVAVTTAAGPITTVEAAPPTTTELISVGEGGAQRVNQSTDPSVSGDGRIVAYTAWSSELQGEADDDIDVLAVDRQTGTTELVSVGTTTPSAAGDATDPDVADDGSAVAFRSSAADLVAGDTNGVDDVFVRHLGSDETELVSVDHAGGPANGHSGQPSISADGRYVAFRSTATDLVPGDTNGEADVFVRDLQSDTTTLVSISSTGGSSNGASELPHLSADGRTVAFSSIATNLGPGPHNILVADVFVRDLDLGSTVQVTFDPDGTATEQLSYATDISGDGRHVVLWSFDALVVAPGVGGRQVYRHDLTTASTELVSATPTGSGGDDESHEATISDDGRYVAFVTEGQALYLCPATPLAGDIVVVRDMVAERAALASALPTGGEAGATVPDLSADGQTIVFASTAPLVPGHTGSVRDVWARGRPSLDQLFSDVVDHHPFRCDIGWLVDEGIGGGFADGTFRPAAPVTRQAMAAFLHRYAGAPAFDLPPEPTFTDVSLDHRFAEEIEWLASTGITQGYADGTFRPTATISRQAMAALFHRLAGEPSVDLPTTPTYPDVLLDHPFFVAIEWLTATGIAEGFDDETFRPTSAVSRQAAAAFLHRYDGVVP